MGSRDNSFFKVNGAKEIAQELDELSRGVNNQIVRPGLRKGAAHIRKIAKKNAPVDDGHLKKAIQSKVISNKGRGKGVVAKIGVLKRSFTDEQGRPVMAYAAEVNEDTKFLDKSITQGSQEAVNILTKSTQEQLDKFHSKRAAKAAAVAKVKI